MLFKCYQKDDKEDYRTSINGKTKQYLDDWRSNMVTERDKWKRIRRRNWANDHTERFYKFLPYT